MSSSFPPEIIDLVIDQLHDEPDALKACCLVSKSWIPRARMHLLAHVEFDPLEHLPESWMKIFPDPPKSPAHYARTLSIRNFPAFAFMGEDAGAWIRTFHKVIHFRLERCTWINRPSAPDSLAPFFGFSPNVRSLRLTSTPFEIFNLICSFPLLEDLELVDISNKDADAGWSAPSTSPKLTGSLRLIARGWTRFTIRRLLDFPDGLRFTKITLMCFGDDFGSVTDLVSACSGTLENLSICRFFRSGFLQPLRLSRTLPLLVDVGTDRVRFPDLSKASKLKVLGFTGKGSIVHWVIAALRSVESKNLQGITIRLNTATFRDEETDNREWEDLDQLLVQFWTSHSIRPRLVYSPNSEGRDMREYAPSLLPGLTRGGLVDLVELPPPF